jgi:hypothetical protein
MAHDYFFTHRKQILAQPVKIIPTEDWLSINMIGYDWAIGCEFAERIGTPSPPLIAGRGFSDRDWLGDEGTANMFPRKIVQGFVAAHLTFAPQYATGEQLEEWWRQYRVISRIGDDDENPQIPIKSAARRPMPQYRIMKSCAYVGEDGVPQRREPGDVVTLTVDAAQILGPRVKLVSLPKPRPAQPKPKVKGQP